MDRIEKLKQFLSANPEDSFLKHAMALEYIRKGDGNMARQLFEQLLEHDPSYVGSYYHLAKLLVQSGDREAALECYRKGMAEAEKAGDTHALNELRMAYEDFSDDY